MSKTRAKTAKFSLSKWIGNVVKAGLTGGILYYLYQKGMLDLSRVKSVLMNPVLFVGCLLMLFATTLAGAVRWWLLLKGQSLKIGLGETFRLTMIGAFFNTAIPGAVSGDVVKGFYVVRQQPDGRGKIRAFTTLLLDRILGLSALVFVSFASMAVNWKATTQVPQLKGLAGLISLLAAGVFLFYVFVLVEWPFADKIQRMLRKLPMGDYLAKLFEAFKAYESARHYFYKGIAISIVIHCVIITAVWILAKSLGGFDSVPAGRFFFLIPFGLIVTAIPIAPAGLGTGHAAFFYLFGLSGSKSGADLFTAFVTFQILISLIGGLFYLRYRSEVPFENGEGP